jgi:hypothetical protein
VLVYSEWLPAVYQHVMVSGHAGFVEELWQHLPYDSSLYADVVHRFKADGQRQALTGNCKKFLVAISDKFIAYAHHASLPPPLSFVLGVV